MNKIKSINVIGRRWTDNYGSTYCTHKTYIDGKLAVKSDDFEYGYGDQFLHYAHRDLIKNNLIKGLDPKGLLTLAARKLGINVTYEAIDGPKKDLLK